MRKKLTQTALHLTYCTNFHKKVVLILKHYYCCIFVMTIHLCRCIASVYFFSQDKTHSAPDLSVQETVHFNWVEMEKRHKHFEDRAMQYSDGEATMQFLRILCNENTVQISSWGNDHLQYSRNKLWSSLRQWVKGHI